MSEWNVAAYLMRHHRDKQSLGGMSGYEARSAGST
jgi:hypothetical protein